MPCTCACSGCDKEATVGKIDGQRVFCGEHAQDASTDPLYLCQQWLDDPEVFAETLGENESLWQKVRPNTLQPKVVIAGPWINLQNFTASHPEPGVSLKVGDAPRLCLVSVSMTARCWARRTRTCSGCTGSTGAARGRSSSRC